MAGNVIHRRGDRVYGEAYAQANILPGYLLEFTTDDADGRPRVKPHSARGGKHRWMVAWEDSLRGMTVLGVLQQSSQVGYASSVPDLVRIGFYKPGSDDCAQMLLHIGENVSKHDPLISYGDGTLAKAADETYADIVAASSTITNVNTITAFSNGTATIPANSLQVGSEIRIRGHAVASATNSTDTLVLTIKIGSTTIAVTPTVDVANGDVGRFDLRLKIRTIGASGTFVAEGATGLGVPGTATMRAVHLGSTAIDTTAAQTITVSATWSVADPGNVVALQSFTVDAIGTGTVSTGIGGANIIGYAEEALNLSAASDPGLLDVAF